LIDIQNGWYNKTIEGGKKMSKKRYDKNYKIEVVRRAREKGKKVVELAEELGIHQNTIYKWIGELHRDKENAFPGSGKLKPDDEELRNLKRENDRLKEEIEILKNAAVYFAKLQK
jgi:transposase